ncbi:MAG TPA: hypothetical protein DEB39_02145 [Planctomycetaceae bacterium]|nr:hypothetical protein [Planctomycetaceae bacterium]
MKKSELKPKPKSEPKKSGNIFDVFVKSMFGRVLVFADFLANYADPKFVAQIDLRKIKPAPTHYVGKDGSERIVDLVFQCPLKNGRGDLMAVIIFEHQSGSLKKIPRKLHKYISGIWDAEAKEGKKVLSAPYFLVLRTGKKPHRGRYPMMADSLPKDANGNPVGRVPEIEYDVVDLPAWEFGKLIGGPVLRLALGILKKMTEDGGDDFGDALLPLLEIVDEEDQIELTQKSLDFITKVFAAHNRRLDAAALGKALKPVFRDKEKFMIKTIFEEKYDEGVAEGEARGEAKAEAKALTEKAETILTFLRARFKKVSKSVEQKIRDAKDKVVLDSWAVHAATCRSLDEFSKYLS